MNCLTKPFLRSLNYLNCRSLNSNSQRPPGYDRWTIVIKNLPWWSVERPLSTICLTIVERTFVTISSFDRWELSFNDSLWRPFNDLVTIPFCNRSTIISNTRFFLSWNDRFWISLSTIVFYDRWTNVCIDNLFRSLGEIFQRSLPTTIHRSFETILFDHCSTIFSNDPFLSLDDQLWLMGSMETIVQL